MLHPQWAFFAGTVKGQVVLRQFNNSKSSEKVLSGFFVLEWNKAKVWLHEKFTAKFGIRSLDYFGATEIEWRFGGVMERLLRCLGYLEWQTHYWLGSKVWFYKIFPDLCLWRSCCSKMTSGLGSSSRIWTDERWSLGSCMGLQWNDVQWGEIWMPYP